MACEVLDRAGWRRFTELVISPPGLLLVEVKKLTSKSLRAAGAAPPVAAPAARFIARYRSRPCLASPSPCPGPWPVPGGKGWRSYRRALQSGEKARASPVAGLFCSFLACARNSPLPSALKKNAGGHSDLNGAAAMPSRLRSPSRHCPGLAGSTTAYSGPPVRAAPPRFSGPIRYRSKHLRNLRPYCPGSDRAPPSQAVPCVVPCNAVSHPAAGTFP